MDFLEIYLLFICLSRKSTCAISEIGSAKFQCGIGKASDMLRARHEARAGAPCRIGQRPLSLGRHVAEGCERAVPIDSKTYFLACCRDIELDPVRARILMALKLFGRNLFRMIRRGTLQCSTSVSGPGRRFMDAGCRPLRGDHEARCRRGIRSAPASSVARASWRSSRPALWLSAPDRSGSSPDDGSISRDCMCCSNVRPISSRYVFSRCVNPRAARRADRSTRSGAHRRS